MWLKTAPRSHLLGVRKDTVVFVVVVVVVVVVVTVGFEVVFKMGLSPRRRGHSSHNVVTVTRVQGGPFSKWAGGLLFSDRVRARARRSEADVPLFASSSSGRRPPNPSPLVPQPVDGC